MAEVIKYSPELTIRNIEALPNGTGAKYLECIRAHTGELIAKQWRNVVTESIARKCEVIIIFGPVVHWSDSKARD